MDRVVRVAVEEDHAGGVPACRRRRWARPRSSAAVRRPPGSSSAGCRRNRRGTGCPPTRTAARSSSPRRSPRADAPRAHRGGGSRAVPCPACRCRRRRTRCRRARSSALPSTRALPAAGRSNRTRRGATRRATEVADRRRPPWRRASSAASPQASRSRFFRCCTTGAGRPICEPPSAIQASCSRTSCAVCQRSFGSFARQVEITRSSAGGESGAIDDTGGGERAHDRRRSATPGSPPRTPSSRSPSRRARSPERRGRCARPTPCPRAAPATCTGTSRGSSPRWSAAPRCCSVGSWPSCRRGSSAAPRHEAWPARNRAASRRARRRRRCPASDRGGRSPRACAFSSASAIWIPSRSTSSIGSGPFAIRSASDSPSSSSMTRKSVSPSRPTS